MHNKRGQGFSQPEAGAKRHQPEANDASDQQKKENPTSAGRRGYYLRFGGFHVETDRSFASAGTNARSSVLRDRRIDLIAPGQNATAKVLHFLEAGFSQEVRDLCAAPTHLAIDDQLVGGIQFVHPRGHLTLRNQARSWNSANIDLVRLTNIEQHEVIVAIHLLFKLDGLDLKF